MPLSVNYPIAPVPAPPEHSLPLTAGEWPVTTATTALSTDISKPQRITIRRIRTRRRRVKRRVLSQLFIGGTLVAGIATNYIGIQAFVSPTHPATSPLISK
jgi:hypothetical protein